MINYTRHVYYMLQVNVVHSNTYRDLVCLCCVTMRVHACTNEVIIELYNSLSLLIILGKVSAYLFIVVIKLHSTSLKLIQTNLLIGGKNNTTNYITASTI